MIARMREPERGSAKNVALAAVFEFYDLEKSDFS